MATVQISDIYNPLVFAGDIQESQLELNRFITSGVAMTNPIIDGMATTGGNIGELPFFKPLGTDEPNYSNDNAGSNSTPKNITSAKQVYRLASQNQSWSVMDLSAELALQDPVAAITGRIGQYWATNNERRAIKSSLGVLADSVANHNSDMVNDVHAATASAVTNDTQISGDAVLDAFQTLGDHDSLVTAMAVHSVQYTALRKQNLIDFIPNARGEVNIPTYMGKQLIVDDSLPVEAVGDTFKYTSILFGAGAFATGEGRVLNPSELDRDPSSGNGGGQEVIYSRRSDIIHPQGYQFTSASVAGQSATQAELSDASNWTRAFERKNIAMAFLVTN